MSDNSPITSITAASLQPELWTSSSNDALQIYITDSDGTALNFHPNFTYPIFGDSEQIFGYRDLVIFLCFDHCTFYPFLNVKYSDKLNDDTLEDPREKLLSYLPESTIFKDEVKWVDSINKEKEGFEIPGELVGNIFTHGDDKFGIYKLDLKNAQGLELHKRLQILVLLFIEAGSYIDHQDELWDIYVMYKVTDAKTPSIIGFCTAYNYWKYGGFEKFDSNQQEVRKKISQFIVLPMYQGLKLGGRFYNKLYEYWMQDPRVIEVVVEDPSESFDDLRDRCDLTRLCQNTIKVASVDLPLINTEWATKLRQEQKLEKRQFSRLLEMILIYQLEHNLTNITKKQVRLFIKKRLYEKNKEILDGLDEPTRLDKLQTAYASLELDYKRILSGLSLHKRALDSTEGSSKKSKPNV